MLQFNSKYIPIKIGMTSVKIIYTSEEVLIIQDLDTIDGIPILKL